MVVALKPGRFYGKALPRPRFYEDVKLNDHRVDPPMPVNRPLLDWAHNAHWSMGGLSFKRTRNQGKIEGKISKLRSWSPSPSPKKRLVGSPRSPRKDKGKSVAEEDEAILPRKRLVKKSLLVGSDGNRSPRRSARLQELASPTRTDSDEYRSAKRSRFESHVDEAGPSKVHGEDESEDEDDSSEIPKTPNPVKTPVVASGGRSKRVLSLTDDSPRPRRSPRVSSKV